MAKKIVEYQTGGGVIYIEGDVPQSAGKFIAKPGSTQVVDAAEAFKDALGPVVAFSKAMIERFNDADIEKPAEVELSFGIKLSGEVKFWVISGAGEGTIDLKLTWKAGQK